MQTGTAPFAVSQLTSVMRGGLKASALRSVIMNAPHTNACDCCRLCCVENAESFSTEGACAVNDRCLSEISF